LPPPSTNDLNYPPFNFVPHGKHHCIISRTCIHSMFMSIDCFF
jgi:hypothetical protein